RRGQRDGQRGPRPAPDEAAALRGREGFPRPGGGGRSVGEDALPAQPGLRAARRRGERAEARRALPAGATRRRGAPAAAPRQGRVRGRNASVTRAPRLWPLALLAAPAVLAQVAGSGAPKVLFRDIRAEAGISFEHHSAPEKKYIVESMAGGVALF